MNAEITRVLNYLSPDEPSRSVNYHFSQWALENFDRLTPDMTLSKIGEMIDDSDSGLCLKFGRQWVQSNKSKILQSCKNSMGIGEAPQLPEPNLKESFKHLKKFSNFN